MKKTQLLFSIPLLGVIGFIGACCLHSDPQFTYQPECSNIDAKTLELPEEFDVHAVSYYEAAYPKGVGHEFRIHNWGEAKVEIGGMVNPFVLVLAAYEPVVWNLELSEVSPGGRSGNQYPLAVIVGGFHCQQVVGLPDNIPVIIKTQSGGSEDFFYEYADRSEHALNQGPGWSSTRSIEQVVTEITHKTGLTTSQYAYQGKKAFLQYGGPITGHCQSHAIGIYKGNSSDQAPDYLGNNPLGKVKVEISPKISPDPIILVLSAYEPTKWTLQNNSQAPIAAVILSGYHTQEIEGIPPTTTIYHKGFHAYKNNELEYAGLEAAVKRMCGAGFDSWQGAYEGEGFLVE